MSIVDKIKQKLHESSLSRIQNATEQYATGSITGYRGELTRAQNQARNRYILNELKKKGFGVTSIKGSYIESYGSPNTREVQEESFFVANIKTEGDDRGELERELIRLGRDTDQDSVLSKPFGQKNAYLIGTSKRDDAFPSYNQKEVVGSFSGGRAGEFFSRIRNRPFTFD